MAEPIIDIQGEKKLLAYMRSLKDSQKKSVVLSAMRKAARPLITEARVTHRNTRKSKGKSIISSAIGTKNMKGSDPGLIVGVRQRGRFTKTHAWVARLIDKGTMERYRKVKGKGMVRTGKITGTGFWTNSARANQNKIGSSLRNLIIKGLKIHRDKAISRGGTQ